MSESEYKRTFHRGERIFREGEPGDCAYVIENGRVEISALREGESVTIATLAPGEFFGEMALIDSRPRSATATAAEDTELIVIRRDQLHDRMAKAHPLLNHFLRVVLERFRATHGVAPERSGAYERDRERAIEALTLERDLRRAVGKNEFELVYQPIATLRGCETAGFEALIRWRHPEQGVIPPGRFIAAAEESGVIVAMGLWVLEEACRTLSLFQDAYATNFPGRPPLFMSVNVSGRQFADPDLIGKAETVLGATAVDPACVKLEITESILLENPDAVAAALEAIKNLGVTLAIDDFGTGYSSLSYLHRFPIDTVKTDQSFVGTLLEESGSVEIVRAIVGLAHTLGMDVVAEGIEAPEEATMLREFDCDYGQGYLLSRPLPANEVSDLVTRGLSW